ncbi:MAG: hypothetical protein RJA75_401 [Actinomycetota bacterium]|jgi:hypothetical protein
MNSFDSFTNELVSETAVAACALADRSEITIGLLLLEEFANAPTLHAIANPALSSVSGSNPNAGLSVGMVNKQSPLGIQGSDVTVVDFNLFDGVNNNHAGFFENELGSNPEDVDNESNGCGCCQVKKENASFAWIEKSLNQEQSVQKESNASPAQVTLGAKNLILFHDSIIAFNSFDGIGNN